MELASLFWVSGLSQASGALGLCFPSCSPFSAVLGASCARAPEEEGGDWQVQTLLAQGKGGSEVRFGQVSRNSHCTRTLEPTATTPGWVG